MMLTSIDLIVLQLTCEKKCPRLHRNIPLNVQQGGGGMKRAQMKKQNNDSSSQVPNL